MPQNPLTNLLFLEDDSSESASSNASKMKITYSLDWVIFVE